MADGPLGITRIKNDLICFYSAAEIFRMGGNPYDYEVCSRQQAEHGWIKAKDGFGIYACMPYYYPPTLLLICCLALPFGFTTAIAGWFAVNILLLLSIVKKFHSDVSNNTKTLSICINLLTLHIFLLGQISFLVTWASLEALCCYAANRSLSALCFLSLAIVKPQMTILHSLCTHGDVWAELAHGDSGHSILFHCQYADL